MSKNTHFILLIFMFNFYFSCLTWAENKEAVHLKDKEENLVRETVLPIDEIENFVKVYTRIKEQFVSPINDAEIINNAIKGMIDNLDAHSSFLNAELFEIFERNLTGEYGGVGLEISKQNSEIIIMTPTYNGPAYHAGLKSGDTIIKINETIIRNQNIEEVNNMLEGAPGTLVELHVKSTKNKISNYKLKRTLIQSPSVYQNEIGNRFVYIRISQFIKNTSEELVNKLEKKNKDIRGLIIDLRDNPGGLLAEAIKTTDLFLSKGLIVSMEDRIGNITEKFTATPPILIDTDIPIIVIINEGTASAAEIMAGALKDNSRSILIGKNSFGKGSVQSLFSLPNKTAAKITTAFYLTPSGRNIKNRGIKPDIIIEPLPFASNDHIASPGHDATNNIQILNNSVDKSSHNNKFDNPTKSDYTLFHAVKALEAVTVFN